MTMDTFGASIDAAIRGKVDPNSEEARTVQIILASVAELQQEFRDRDRLYQDIDKVIYLENAVNIPKNYKKSAIEVRSPLPVHITNSITAALSIKPPKVQFEPVGIGDSYEENAALRERYFDGSWLRQEQEAERRLFRLWVHSIVTKGEGILKTIERKQRAWAGYNRYSKKLLADNATTGLSQREQDRVYNTQTEEYKRGTPYPISSTDVPPETFYYTKGEDGFQTCVEVKLVPYYTTLVRYSMGLNLKGEVVPEAMGLPRHDWHKCMGKTTMLQMIEYWDWEKVTYILQGPADISKKGTGKVGQGLVVKTIKHRYGDKDLKTLKGPYFHAHGITTSSREIYKQGLGVLFGYLHLFPLLDSLLTIQSQSAFMYGFPSFKRTTPQAFGLPDAQTPYGMDAREGTQTKEVLVPGGVLPYDIAPIEMPRGGVDLDKTIAMIRNLLELALPGAAQGLTGGGDSGYLLNQAAHLARLAWQPIVDNAEFALAKRTGFESELIEKCIGETVYVYGNRPGITGNTNKRADKGWLGIGPPDLSGIHRYTVHIDPDTPSNKTLEIRSHHDLLEMRLETPEQAIEAMGNNPIEVERAWLLHDLKKDPAIYRQLQMRVFKKLATMDQQAMLDNGITQPGTPALPAQQGAQLPGTPVTPFGQPIPNGPAPVGAPAPQGAPLPGPGTPGTPPGVPGGVRNIPLNAQTIPGRG